MNKLIIGGALIAIMGGAPTVTYFLTKEENSSKASETKKVENIQTSDESGTESDCRPSDEDEDEDECPRTKVE